MARHLSQFTRVVRRWPSSRTEKQDLNRLSAVVSWKKDSLTHYLQKPQESVQMQQWWKPSPVLFVDSKPGESTLSTDKRHFEWDILIEHWAFFCEGPNCLAGEHVADSSCDTEWHFQLKGCQQHSKMHTGMNAVWISSLQTQKPWDPPQTLLTLIVVQVKTKSQVSFHSLVHLELWKSCECHATPLCALHWPQVFQANIVCLSLISSLHQLAGDWGEHREETRW